jgi:hypothetical protein
MESKKIRKFLSELEDIDFRYLRIQISMANDARNLIKEFNLTKEQFCKFMVIDPDNSEYQSYIQGGYDYTVMHMARLQAAYCKLSAEKITAKGKFTDIATEETNNDK